MLQKIKLYFIKKKYGIKDQDTLSYQEMIENNWRNGYHPKIKWDNQDERELNRKKFIKYQIRIQSKKFNL